MKKLSSFVLMLMLGLVLSTAVSAKAPVAGTWSGTLIDKHCSSMMTADKAVTHEKSCAMKCAKNGHGLGMMVGDTWYSFDKKGEKLAWNILKGSTATSDIEVNVNGKLSGTKISVTSMTAKG